MIAPKHTPAPWKVGNLESYEMDGTPFRRVYFPRDHLEIQEAHIRGDNCDANAHLIAAAPDMLEALEAAQAMHQRYCDRVAAADGWARSLKSQIDAAIAKAKGGDA